MVKFIDADATTEAQEISAVDRGVLELKNAVANLDAQIANIQSKIDGSVSSFGIHLAFSYRPPSSIIPLQPDIFPPPYHPQTSFTLGAFVICNCQTN